MRGDCGEGECVNKVAPMRLASYYATTFRGKKSGSQPLRFRLPRNPNLAPFNAGKDFTIIIVSRLNRTGGICVRHHPPSQPVPQSKCPQPVRSRRPNVAPRRPLFLRAQGSPVLHCMERSGLGHPPVAQTGDQEPGSRLAGEVGAP